MKKLYEQWTSISLVKRIVVGLIIGAVLGLAAPQASGLVILGDVFVGALKGIAPLLVFFLIISFLMSCSQKPRRCHQNRYYSVYVQYLLSITDRSICQPLIPGHTDTDCGGR